jgi:hypothetical protein
LTGAAYAALDMGITAGPSKAKQQAKRRLLDLVSSKKPQLLNVAA